MKHIHTFENFLVVANAFNTKMLKNSNFILYAFDKPYSDTFEINFNANAPKDEIEKALKSEKKFKDDYELLVDDGQLKLTIKPTKNNVSLSWALGALDDLYGKYGASMGWGL